MAENPRMCAHAHALRHAVQLTLRAVGDDLSEENTLFQISPGRSHIRWLLGHLAVSCDLFIGATLGRSPSLPLSYSQSFGFGTQPATDGSAYPPLPELVESLQDVTDGVGAYIESLPDGKLEEELPDGSPVKALFRTYGELLHASGYHTGYHTGQITLLRRAQGLPSALGM